MAVKRVVVMKFGGTSVGDATAISRVVDIVAQAKGWHRQPVVVVSAISGATSMLLEVAELAAQMKLDEALIKLDHLLERHALIVDELQLKDAHQTINVYFEELESICRGIALIGKTDRSLDAMASFGERLSSFILAEAMKKHGLSVVLVDARTVIITDNHFTGATPLVGRIEETAKSIIWPHLSNSIVVTQGFIGATVDGIVTTLGRGGSDYSAALLGSAINAEEIQIWTDVDGMLTCDPRIADGGHRVKVISFDEAAELAYFGAKVLHPSTVWPALEKSIPVLILNSRRPEEGEGTRIVSGPITCSNVAKSIACKQHITVLNIHSTRMLMAYGFLRRIFEVFDRFETPVDMVTTSEVSVSLTIDNLNKIDSIVDELRQFAEVTVNLDQAIVCLVGDGIHSASNVSARVFGALGDINVRMISQGASRLNLSLVVNEADLKCSVELLHTEFFSELDPTVFG